jgi:DNA-binding XRE family transcriptional regulator
MRRNQYICYHLKGAAKTMLIEPLEQHQRVEQHTMPAPTSRRPLPGLARARVRAYLTQPQLAEKAGVSKSTVARIEQGYPASAIAAQRLADALGTTVEHLQEKEPQS